MAAINAGELKDRIELLELDETDVGFGWRVKKILWANAEVTEKTNRFSTLGIGLQGVVFTIRRREITLHNAIRWNGHHCFLTAISKPGAGHLKVTAAMTTLSFCKGNVNKPKPGPSFPAVLTEKYLSHAQEAPMATNTVTYVLVTPKDIVLEPGPLIQVDGETYKVAVAHTLEEYKNEYELIGKRDL